MKLKLLIAILALQSAWMLGTIFVQERGLHEGVRVLLQTRPVDPRDLLRGDYVILSYDISDVRRDCFRPPLASDLPPGQTVFVALRPEGEFHVIDFASTNAIEGAAGPVLRGKTVQTWRRTVEYGLERYYVREGTGNPTGKLTVEVAVPKSGRGLIKQVFVNGKPYAEAMKSQRK